jgi:hypothetical protein
MLVERPERSDSAHEVLEITGRCARSRSRFLFPIFFISQVEVLFGVPANVTDFGRGCENGMQGGTDALLLCRVRCAHPFLVERQSRLYETQPTQLVTMTLAPGSLRSMVGGFIIGGAVDGPNSNGCVQRRYRLQKRISASAIRRVHHKTPRWPSHDAESECFHHR